MQAIEPYKFNMTYPKALMSITELVKMGFSRETLKEYSRVKDAPTTRTGGGGKILFVMSDFNEFVQKIEERKKMQRRR